jgi:hypothetical protein
VIDPLALPRHARALREPLRTHATHNVGSLDGERIGMQRTAQGVKAGRVNGPFHRVSFTSIVEHRPRAISTIESDCLERKAAPLAALVGETRCYLKSRAGFRPM